MQLPHGRHLILLTAAMAISSLLLVAFTVFILQTGMNPRTASLAFRIDASKARSMLRTTNREWFLDTIKKLSENDLKNLPNGDIYEFATLETGSGSAWIIYVHDTKAEKHMTLLSDEDPTLFLPINPSRSSLGKTSLFTNYIGTQDQEYLWMTPEALPKTMSLLGTLKEVLLDEAQSLLLLPENNHLQGTLLIQRKKSATFKPIAPRKTLDPLPAFTLDIGDPSLVLQSTIRFLEEKNPALLEGLIGILQKMEQKTFGTTDLTLLRNDLLAGPVTLLLEKNNETFSVGVKGIALKAHSFSGWLSRAASQEQAGEIRTIPLFKGENLRRDVHGGSGTTLKQNGQYNGWALQQEGSSGSLQTLYSATKEKKYVISTSPVLLSKMLTEPSGESPGENRLAAKGSVDLPWLLQTLERDAPVIAEGMRNDVEMLFGASLSRFTWSLQPMTQGWSIAWSFTK